MDSHIKWIAAAKRRGNADLGSWSLTFDGAKGPDLDAGYRQMGAEPGADADWRIARH